jgi:holo-[acyl-carrier protein] synthase
VIVGIGVDLCSVERWEAMVARRPAVVARLLTPAEAAKNPTSQAARFAAKEALAKALGAPMGLAWLDAEVVTELGVTRVHLSISHDAGLAIAYVVCEGA